MKIKVIFKDYTEAVSVRRLLISDAFGGEAPCYPF
jgi:hypothetical protein